MVPPDDDPDTGGRVPGGTATTFICPRCTGTVSRRGNSLRCVRCRYVPKHGAD